MPGQEEAGGKRVRLVWHLEIHGHGRDRPGFVHFSPEALANHSFFFFLGLQLDLVSEKRCLRFYEARRKNSFVLLNKDNYKKVHASLLVMLQPNTS